MRRPAIGPLFLAALLLLTARTGRAAPDGPLAERFLLEGKLAEGEAALVAALEQNPGDAQARFGLGATQFLRGVERKIVEVPVAESPPPRAPSRAHPP